MIANLGPVTNWNGVHSVITLITWWLTCSILCNDENTEGESHGFSHLELEWHVLQGFIHICSGKMQFFNWMLNHVPRWPAGLTFFFLLSHSSLFLGFSRHPGKRNWIHLRSFYNVYQCERPFACVIDFLNRLNFSPKEIHLLHLIQVFTWNGKFVQIVKLWMLQIIISRSSKNNNYYYYHYVKGRTFNLARMRRFNTFMKFHMRKLTGPQSTVIIVSQSVILTFFFIFFFIFFPVFCFMRSSSTTSMGNWFYCEKCLNQKWIEWNETSMKTENYKLWFRTFKFYSQKIVIICHVGLLSVQLIIGYNGTVEIRTQLIFHILLITIFLAIEKILNTPSCHVSIHFLNIIKYVRYSARLPVARSP